MGVKSDKWIRQMAETHGMIDPFEPSQVKAIKRVVRDNFAEGEYEERVPCDPCEPGAEKIISYGTSSYGYDLRCAADWRIFTNVNSAIVDPKALPDTAFVVSNEETIIIPPNSFALGRSLERFKIPRGVITICLGKSTYARCGIIVNVTPLEPEWEGHVTMEFSNTTPLPVRMYAYEGCAQILFLGADFETTETISSLTEYPVDVLTVATIPGLGRATIRRGICETSYADRGGKYQGQLGVTLPTV